MSLRVMFDSNAYDAILAHGDAERIHDLVADEKFSVVTTHVQEDELLQIPNKDRQLALLSIYRRICTTSTPTSVGVWDVSRWDQFKWAGQEEKRSFERIQRNKTIASRDEIIGVTAKDQCDVFVSQDGSFRKRLTAEAPALRVLPYEDFRKEFLA